MDIEQRTKRMDIKHRTKQLVATVVLAGAVTAGTAGVAVAAEGDAGSGSASAPVAEHHPRRAHRRLAAVVRETLGVERGDLRAALQGGQSIGEYATSLGKDPQVVVDALLGAVNTRVERAVANGRITAERGDEIKANAPARIDRLVNRHVGPGAGS